MKNELIKSFYDITEQPEGLDRREFLKKAGLAGLALAGLGAGLGSLGGCAHVDRTDYDYNAIAKNYESNPIQIRGIDDFALFGEELGEMRFSKGLEKGVIPLSSENPLKGRTNEYPLPDRKMDAPLCEEWLFGENVGKNWYPWYRITVFARKFNSKEESLIVEEKIKNMPFSKVKYLAERLHYGRAPPYREEASFNIFSKHPYIVEFVTGGLLFSGKGGEHVLRTRLYQTKRGLKFVRGNFDNRTLLNPEKFPFNHGKDLTEQK